MNLKGKKVLITGATGFVGSFLTARLLKEGCKVKILTFDNLGMIRHLRGKVEVVRGNICRPLGKKLKGVDVIFHLAALTDLRTCIDDPVKAFNINTFGTFNLLREALPLKLEKFVYLNSASVYGTPEYIPVDENHPGALLARSTVWGGRARLARLLAGVLGSPLCQPRRVDGVIQWRASHPPSGSPCPPDDILPPRRPPLPEQTARL